VRNADLGEYVLFLFLSLCFFSPLSMMRFFSAGLAPRTGSLQDELSAVVSIREGTGGKPRGTAPLLVSS